MRRVCAHHSCGRGLLHDDQKWCPKHKPDTDNLFDAPDTGGFL